MFIVLLVLLGVWLVPAIAFTVWFLMTDSEFRDYKTVLNGCHWMIIPLAAICWPYFVVLSVDDAIKPRIEFRKGRR